MATKIKQILDAAPQGAILFGEWLARQGLDSQGQYKYMKSGWPLHANCDHNQTKTKESIPFILTGRMCVCFFWR